MPPAASTLRCSKRGPSTCQLRPRRGSTRPAHVIRHGPVRKARSAPTPLEAMPLSHDVQHIYADVEADCAQTFGANRVEPLRHDLDTVSAQHTATRPPVRPTLGNE